MSGEVRLLDENGETRRLVLALETLVASVSAEHFALIGGLAVMARLGQAHRGTQDIDTAVDRERAIPSELDVVFDAAPSTEKVATRQRVKVDSIEVGDTSAVDLSPENLPEEEFPRAFVLSHRWAFDTASELTLRCLQRERPDTIVACRVATPAALVAMKLQSAPRRPPARVQKAANDYLDLSLLLSNFGAAPRDHRGVGRIPTRPRCVVRRADRQRLRRRRCSGLVQDPPESILKAGDARRVEPDRAQVSRDVRSARLTALQSTRPVGSGRLNEAPIQKRQPAVTQLHGLCTTETTRSPFSPTIAVAALRVGVSPV